MPAVFPFIHIKASCSQAVLQGFECFVGAVHQSLVGLGELVAVGIEFHQRFQQSVLIQGLGFDQHLASVLEEVADASALAQVAAVLAEGQTQFRCRAVAVVAQDFHQHRHATGAVALVAHRFQVNAVPALAGALGDSAFDVPCRHAGGFGFGNGGAQLKVALRVTALACGHRDFASDAGEHSPPLGIHHGLGSFDLGPFAVACHRQL